MSQIEIFGTILLKGYCTNIEENCPSQWHTTRDNIPQISAITLYYYMTVI
jgi:hypothetical protein